MAFGMAAAHQAELVAARADEADHVDGIAEAVEWRGKGPLARPIAAKGDHVPEAARRDQPVVWRQLLPSRLEAGHVRGPLCAPRPAARSALRRPPPRLG